MRLWRWWWWRRTRNIFNGYRIVLMGVSGGGGRGFQTYSLFSKNMVGP